MGLCSSAAAFPSGSSLLLLSLGTPSSSLPRPGWPEPPFFPKLEKKKLTGALNLRAGGLLAGGLGAGAAAGAASYLVKFVLPSEWTQAPGATGGPLASLARSLCLAPARSASLAPRPPPPSRARSGPPTPTTASFQYGILSVRMPGTLF